MVPTSSHRDAGIAGAAFRATAPQDLELGVYDLAVHASSWDKRSVCMTTSETLKANVGVLILPRLTDTQGNRERHDRILKDFCSNRYEQLTTIEEESTRLQEVWQQLFRSVVNARVRFGKALNVFLDLSTCPRYFSLGVVALCLGEGLARRITCVYAEGSYPTVQPQRGGSEEVSFSTGQWQAVPVPYLQGEYGPFKKRFYLVSVGFEGWKTMRVVSRADPDRVSLLFPDPGVAPDYVQRAEEANSRLVQEFCIPTSQVIRAHAADAIAAWIRLTAASCERPLEENTFYVCSGTKPHSLGLALRALVLRKPSVLYNLPENHTPIAVEPNGVYWRYDVENLLVPQ